MLPLDSSNASCLPELLAPAGSPEALEAAIRAGADAVYAGGSAFNARMNAHNFDRGELEAAVQTAHHAGVRVYLTLNTLIFDRELPAALDAAYEAAVCGIDGLIIADLGAASIIHRALPSLPLHASTQLSGHCRTVGEILVPFGFSRFVMAREASLSDLRAAATGEMEVEVFIHGALCVSHSGQCLFSSLVGGRSGNRGLCAQPCRLPYRCEGKRSGRDEFPLSLKDLSLARHVPALIESGVSSLKIEGRMKSPAYVGGVTAVWRRLLDERRAANETDMRKLSELFSREGFTDGYFRGRIDHRMTGVRTKGDKARTAEAERSATSARDSAALPLAMTATIRTNEPIAVTVQVPLFRQNNPEIVEITVAGDVPAVAQNPSAALTPESAKKHLSKTGGTGYRVTHISVDADTGLLLPISRLNALRRAALDAADRARMAKMPVPALPYDASVREGLALPRRTADTSVIPCRSARFYRPVQITVLAEETFDIIYLPMLHWAPARDNGSRHGVILPPVIFDRETDTCMSRLTDILHMGARDILVGNVGHLPLVRKVLNDLSDAIDPASIILHGDFRLNATNAATVEQLLSLGFQDVILSPELTFPRLRDISDSHPGRTCIMVYGRTPLMLLEKCAIRALYDTPTDKNAPLGSSKSACSVCGRDVAVMVDRKGVSFPILREFDHRNTVYNSLPLSMTDRRNDLDRAHITHEHYLFSVESPDRVDAVIRAAKNGAPIGGEVRRVMK